MFATRNATCTRHHRAAEPSRRNAGPVQLKAQGIASCSARSPAPELELQSSGGHGDPTPGWCLRSPTCPTQCYLKVGTIGTTLATRGNIGILLRWLKPLVCLHVSHRTTLGVEQDGVLRGVQLLWSWLRCHRKGCVVSQADTARSRAVCYEVLDRWSRLAEAYPALFQEIICPHNKLLRRWPVAPHVSYCILYIPM